MECHLRVVGARFSVSDQSVSAADPAGSARAADGTSLVPRRPRADRPAVAGCSRAHLTNRLQVVHVSHSDSDLSRLVSSRVAPSRVAGLSSSRLDLLLSHIIYALIAISLPIH